MSIKKPRFYIWRPRATGLAAVLLVLCMVGYVLVYPNTIAKAYPADRPLPIYCVDCPQKTCAISFDAAWGNGKVRRHRCKVWAHFLCADDQNRFFTGGCGQAEFSTQKSLTMDCV